MFKNILVGNGVNIQHGGFYFCNTAIILRTLKHFKDPNFPRHILMDDPIEAKCYIGYLFLETKRILAEKDGSYANSMTEKESLEEFKNKYKNKDSLRITDIGFEDYYLIHDILCNRLKIHNKDRNSIGEALKWCFLHSIYDSGRVNTSYYNYSMEFTKWLKGFDQIFTTNYDNNIELATGKTVFHLHGDFSTRSDIYLLDSFRNQLSDCPYNDYIIDENYSHLYSTALTTYSGNYKQYSMEKGKLANDAVDKIAKGYAENTMIQEDVDSWENDRNVLLTRMKESIILKVENPDLKFQEPYPIRQLQDMEGELVILGLSPYNDRHLFKIINNSRASKCIFYYYDVKEKDIVSTLLSNLDIKFEDARSFWGNNMSKKSRSKKKGKRITIKDITKADFHKFAECYRGLSASIMGDNDIIRQFNATPYNVRVQIYKRIKELEVERDRTIDQQFILSIVDLHVIAAEFDIDPAVVCCVGTDQCRNEYIRIR